MSSINLAILLDKAINYNSGRLRPVHIALYAVIIRLFDRNGYPETLPLPSDMVMARAGIMNGKTFRKTISELEQLGLLKVVEKAKNQHSAVTVKLSNLPDHLPDQKLDRHENLPDQKLDKHENLPDQKLDKQNLPDQKLDRHENLPDQKLDKHENLPDQKLDKQNLPDHKMNRHENLPDQKLDKHENLPDQKLDKQNLPDQMPDQKLDRQIEFCETEKNIDTDGNISNNGHFSDFVTSGENLPDQNLDRQTDIYILYNNNNIDSNKEYNKEINNIINNKHICQIFEKNEETKPSKKKEKSCAKKENDDGSFERFWGMYPVERHSNMKYCREYWYNRLTDDERQAIIERLPAYIASVSDTKYLKLTEFFFKNQKFRDEAFMHAGINGNGKNGSGGNGRLSEVKDLRTSTDYSEAIAKMNYCQRNNIPQSEWKKIDWTKIDLNQYKS